MTKIYLCTQCIAKEHLVNADILYMKAHHNVHSTLVYCDWLEEDIIDKLAHHGWKNVILLLDPKDNIKVMLTLVDPLFREVYTTDMSLELIDNVDSNWTIWC